MGYDEGGKSRIGQIILKTLLCEGMFCTNNVKFILIASVVIVNMGDSSVTCVTFSQLFSSLNLCR